MILQSNKILGRNLTPGPFHSRDCSLMELSSICYMILKYIIGLVGCFLPSKISTLTAQGLTCCLLPSSVFYFSSFMK